MSVKQFLGAATIAGAAFVSSASADEACNVNFIDVSRVVDHLLVIQTKEWNTATLASFGSDNLKAIVDEIDHRSVKLQTITENTLDNLARAAKKGSDVNWDKVYDSSPLAIWPILDDLKSSRLTEVAVDNVRADAKIAMTDFLSDAMKAVNDIDTDDATPLCLEGPVVAPAI